MAREHVLIHARRSARLYTNYGVELAISATVSHAGQRITMLARNALYSA
jgi:hypothetical protein